MRSLLVVVHVAAAHLLLPSRPLQLLADRHSLDRQLVVAHKAAYGKRVKATALSGCITLIYLTS